MSISSRGFPIRALRGIQRVRRSFELVHGALAALILLSLSGCNAMSSPQEAGMELAVKIDTSKPIRFSTHSFGAHCFDATECRVVYFGRIIRSGSKEAVPLPAGDLSRRLIAPHIGIPNFQSPVQVSWIASDGTLLHAEVDVAQIFKDQIVLHQVPKDQLPNFLFSPIEPEIIVVVRDRTIDVCMRAHIPTVSLQDPDNSYTDFRNDLVFVHSRSY